MSLIIIFFLLSINTAVSDRRPGLNESCPLCDYVFREDGVFEYTVLEVIDRNEDANIPVSTHMINMTSQRWKDESWTNWPIWWHHMAIHVPDEIIHPEHAFIYVSYRSNTNSVPGLDTDHLNKTAFYAAATGMVAATLWMVPNQPVIYTDDPRQKERSEDDSISYTWNVFMDTERDNPPADPEVVLRMPMVKAVVKTMDTIELYVNIDLGRGSINKFMVAGESKRGWTTWMTGPIEDRVVAMAPVVLSSLNMHPCFHHYFMSFGGWPLYFWDYWKTGMMGRIDDDETFALYDVVDPFSYSQWMGDIPKLIVSAASDEFFLLDDTHYWWADMPGEKYFWLLENSGHWIAGAPAYEDYWRMLQTFFLAVITEYERPAITWDLIEAEEAGEIGGIRLHSQNVAPTYISAYSALSVDPDRRDWRLHIPCNVSQEGFCEKESDIVWEEQEVEDQGNGVYQVEYEVPQLYDGFLAFYIRMEYPGPDGRSFIFTTEANVLPSYFPYEDCLGRNCTGILK